MNLGFWGRKNKKITGNMPEAGRMSPQSSPPHWQPKPQAHKWAEIYPAWITKHIIFAGQTFPITTGNWEISTQPHPLWFLFSPDQLYHEALTLGSKFLRFTCLHTLKSTQVPQSRENGYPCGFKFGSDFCRKFFKRKERGKRKINPAKDMKAEKKKAFPRYAELL